uniref:Uncharacterized protein n=1 Tax=Anguilla anguilla TaxID=7936 RepID=A0A0E9T8B7_ANGAN
MVMLLGLGTHMCRTIILNLKTLKILTEIGIECFYILI